MIKKDKHYGVCVGIGIVIINEDNKVLVGKRKNSLAPFYSIPGGNLEIGETFEEGAIRETLEETGLTIQNPKVISVTNNLHTFREEGIHNVSITMLVKNFFGKPKPMEPHKCEKWIWVKLDNLPQPHFDASRMSIECYLENKIYKSS